MEGGRVQGDELVTIELVGVEKDHTPCGEVHSGGHGGCGEHRIKVSSVHHCFHDGFPQRKLTSVVGTDPGMAQGLQLLVVFQVRVSREHLVEVPLKGFPVPVI